MSPWQPAWLYLKTRKIHIVILRLSKTPPHIIEALLHSVTILCWFLFCFEFNIPAKVNLLGHYNDLIFLTLNHVPINCNDTI